MCLYKNAILNFQGMKLEKNICWRVYDFKMQSVLVQGNNDLWHAAKSDFENLIR